MDLNGVWKLYYYPAYEQEITSVAELKNADVPCIPATVPGNVELDLSAAGILPKDLFKGMNILKAEQFEHYDWWYETEFIAPAAPAEDQDVFLRFGAVDCYAEYFVNGEKIGESANMFVAQEFDVTGQLYYGQTNTLHVHIRSAILESAKKEVEPNCVFYSSHRTKEHLHTRKAAHGYGWDIMPRAISAGIWRDVTLDYKNKCRFRYFNLSTWKAVEGGVSEAYLTYDLELTAPYVLQNFTCTVSGSCGDSSFSCTVPAKGRAERVFLEIPNSKLWWPKHYGEPNLYDVHIELVSADGKVRIAADTKFGLRTVQLKHSDLVEEGGGFEFIINNTRIMAMGSNWVPMDVYHSRDASRYEKALNLADEAGCNILRCWGGNVYEDHAFFDYCDAHGIMVWQDFAMACHYYPQSEDFLRVIEAEAEWVVRTYFNHASIVLWSGDNEIDEQTAARGGDPGNNRITREILPHVVQRWDPHRPYIASSPYVSPRAFAAGSSAQGSKLKPEDHLWGPRAFHKDAFFRDSAAYFVSESGYHGCPARSSLEKFLDADMVWPYTDNEQWNLHSTDQMNNPGRVQLMHKQVKQMFGKVPETIDDYVLASQICQAEAKKYFIERIRVNMQRNGGIIWWNLVDGWPQESDAVVDYYYEKKLAYSYIKRSQQGFMIMADELKKGWTQSIVCCNSTQKPVSGQCTISDLDTGEVLLNTSFTAAANANTLLADIPAWHSEQRMLIIAWEADGKRGFNTYLTGTPGYDFAQYKQWVQKIAALSETMQ